MHETEARGPRSAVAGDEAIVVFQPRWFGPALAGYPFVRVRENGTRHAGQNGSPHAGQDNDNSFGFGRDPDRNFLREIIGFHAEWA